VVAEFDRDGRRENGVAVTMKVIRVLFALMAVIGGLHMLFAVHSRGWMFGIPTLAAGLTYLWYRSGVLGLK
jgi:hypothetical protein